jgi:hypothetical protein
LPIGIGAQAATRALPVRGRRLLAVLCLATIASLAWGTVAAQAATPPQTDVMLLFDTSGSMTSALEEAKSEIKEVMSNVSASLPNVEFGLAEVRDYGGSSYDPESSDEPWRLDVPLTSNAATVEGAIDGLSAEGGGDGPEAYGRALWETDTNPSVGWRPEASHVIVLVADNVPHDNNLDEGIPEDEWIEPSPWDTGEELPGTWGIPDTTWAPGEDLDFQSVLQQLKRDGKPLEMVDYHDTSENFLPYWEYWAGLSGGQALEASSGELPTKLTTVVKEGARVAPNNAFVTLYDASVPRALRLQTPTPGPLSIPFGAELAPTVSVSARVQPTDPQPALNLSNSASFLSFGPLSFSLLDFKWQGSSTSGPAPAAGLFEGSSIGFEAQLGLLGAPTIDDGEGDPLEAAFSVPVADIEAKLPPAELPPTGVVVPEVQIGGGLDLNIKLYITQAVTYAGEKLAEGAVAAVSEVLSDGVDTGLVVEALDALQTAEVAATAAKYAEMAVKAKTLWNLSVNQGIPIAELLGQLVSAEAPQLLGQVTSYVAGKLKVAVTWVANGVSHVVTGIYDGGVWVVQTGGHLISGAGHVAGHVLSKGYHFVTGLFSANRSLPVSATFEALPIVSLPAKRLRSSRALGFAPQVLSRQAARIAAHALVKYGFTVATVRPLLVNNLAPKAGSELCVAAGRLTSAGTANLELTGPGYRGQALIRTRSHVGGACVKLPAKMAAGRWTIGIVDYNEHAARAGVLVDAYAFTVTAPHRRRRR